MTFRPLRLLACLATLATLAACASGPKISASDEANGYASRARRSYTAPGPASDPWGPYIIEAAVKYDVPEKWVREVVRQESGGHLFEHGKLIISSAGAMGLMQVMPATYDELRARYRLGNDPYEPHDNIMAGTAYLRELYEVYGSPGFLAAYNAGPGRLDDYLTRRRPLPEETRRYVARIGGAIGDVQPQRVSAAQQLAMNQLPINIPAGPRYPTRNQAPVALAANSRSSTNRYDRGTIQMASLPMSPAASALPEPPLVAAAAPAPVTMAAAQPTSRGFHFIPQALADTVPTQRGGPANGAWAIQVGAFGNEALARAATDSARRSTESLASSRPAIGTVHQGSGTLYRARLTGLSRDAAVQACERISHGRGNCIVLSPGAQT